MWCSHGFRNDKLFKPHSSQGHVDGRDGPPAEAGPYFERIRAPTVDDINPAAPIIRKIP